MSKDQWSSGPADDSIPPQIARLSGRNIYNTFIDSAGEYNEILQDADDGEVIFHFLGIASLTIAI
jgi:hypothetical protein